MDAKQWTLNNGRSILFANATATLHHTYAKKKPEDHLMPETELFRKAYDRDEVAYGYEPSQPVAECLRQFAGQSDGQVGKQSAGVRTCHALDLGAGAGRDTMALAQAGFHTHAVDLCDRGLQRIADRANELGLRHVTTEVADARGYQIETAKYDFIVGTTILDHIANDDAAALFAQMVGGLSDEGVLYVEVHSTSDPGCDIAPGCHSDAPVSETAAGVVNYFPPGQLLRWVIESDPALRVLDYQERLEWDYTHGPAHQHGKAIVLAVRDGHFPEWYGSPAAFEQKA